MASELRAQYDEFVQFFVYCEFSLYIGVSHTGKEIVPFKRREKRGQNMLASHTRVLYTRVAFMPLYEYLTYVRVQLAVQYIQYMQVLSMQSYFKHKIFKNSVVLLKIALS